MLIIALIHLIWCYFTDYHLSLWIWSNIQNVDLLTSAYDHLHLNTWNSIYSGPYNSLHIIKTIIIALGTRSFTCFTINRIYIGKKIKWFVVIGLAFLWFGKIPIPVEESTFIATYSALLVW